MSNILVTGINGFVGHHVASALSSMGHTVIGVSNQPEIQQDLIDITDTYFSCDLTDAEQVSNIDLCNIDAIINLAGFAKVGDSKGQGDLYNRVNIGVHTILYAECLKQNVKPRIIAVSTGAVYDPGQSLPITEKSRLISPEKTNEYVVSKQLMEQSLSRFAEKGLNIIVARPFNHSGPGQLGGFLIPDLAEQILIAKANKTPLYVGNLKTRRDYTDVRDVAKAYALLATVDSKLLKHDTYNICSGISVEGETILEYMLTAFNETDLALAVDETKIRKNDVPDIYGSSKWLQDDTGWKAKIDARQMTEDFVQWLRTK